jgi:hypothetical protein
VHEEAVADVLQQATKPTEPNSLRNWAVAGAGLLEGAAAAAVPG